MKKPLNHHQLIKKKMILILLTLLAVGTYTSYKIMNNKSIKVRFDKLMVYFDPSNDAHIDEFLSILKSSREK